MPPPVSTRDCPVHNASFAQLTLSILHADLLVDAAQVVVGKFYTAHVPQCPRTFHPGFYIRRTDFLRSTESRPRKQRPGEAEIESSWRSAENNPAAYDHLWQTHGPKLLKVASAFASPEEMDQALIPILQSDPKAEQIVLEHSAARGNVALLQHMLQRMRPPPQALGTFLRLHAVTGGVEIWRALLAYNPECLHWEIGEHGDALGQAVLKKDTELVRFLLAQGINVKNSNFVGMPVLPAAKGVGANSEIIDLLTSYGAPAS